MQTYFLVHSHVSACIIQASLLYFLCVRFSTLFFCFFACLYPRHVEDLFPVLVKGIISVHDSFVLIIFLCCSYALFFSMNLLFISFLPSSLIFFRSFFSNSKKAKHVIIPIITITQSYYYHHHLSLHSYNTRLTSVDIITKTLMSSLKIQNRSEQKADT